MSSTSAINSAGPLHRSTPIAEPRTAPRFNTLKVLDVRRETSDAVSIAFDASACPDQYRFVPGQYLTLRRVFDGHEVRRCYSISSGIGDGELRVVVKNVPGGIFSSFANENLAPGAELDVMTPAGTFGIEPDPDVSRNYVAFAAGSGITPIISIIRSVLDYERHSHFTLLYGNQDSNSIIFKEALEDLKDSYLTRFSLVHFLSREVSQLPLHSGRLDPDKLEALARLHFDPANLDHAFLCGPGEMVAMLRDGLAKLGLDPAKIHFELFTPSEKLNVLRIPVRTEKSNSDAVEVTAILNGVGRRFKMNEGDGNVVDAALLNGVSLPYSCKGGMCSTCRARVSEGSVVMATNYSLEPWEVNEGYVLTCQARPTSPTLVLDFDQV
ncbi:MULTISPECIES: 2Fe-2S iron-sulfur cluster-binding protein [Variovorax]|jgi:ring-1,2-phenylacetyl-CoA epoxidase subunit PaaE|uniref:2Fe-2S iron-sulfur cluster-binding protein n=1 Tax=Variovorax TaxID=34072 RepID=UPI000AEAA4CC|nr:MULTISPECIES: 2Fe-2S iron-sulfur cluster-binding protein [Variovorax]UKI08686.1 2Fe-2S iron-sulfur cluster-binding protein [Variovorax paradoxus]